MSQTTPKRQRASQEVISRIRDVLGQVAPKAQVILYGSQAHGDALTDSDIDLLILIDEPKLTPEREHEIIRPYDTKIIAATPLRPPPTPCNM